jgi:acetyl esterase/lipase
MTDQAEFDAQLCEMGAQFSPPVMMKTREMFRAPLQATDWGTTAPVADLAYGDHPRQKLDIYRTARNNAPIVLFVHGGGFVAGDKASDPIFYGNVPRYFASKGYLGVAMNYRLAPEVTWPAGSEDVAAALAWLVAHAAEYGGDPTRIVILGQSAGAAHTASVIFDDRFVLPAAVKGAALLSGFYTAVAPMEGGPKFYYGADEEAQWADRSPLGHVKTGHIPLMLGVAAFDPAIIADQTLQLAQALNQADGQPPRMHWWANHNHVSPVHSLGLGTDLVGTVLRDYFDSVLG